MLSSIDPFTADDEHTLFHAVSKENLVNVSKCVVSYVSSLSSVVNQSTTENP
jgi:hypothetical protein